MKGTTDPGTMSHPLVNWSTVRRLTKLGGLGVTDLEKFGAHYDFAGLGLHGLMPLGHVWAPGFPARLWTWPFSVHPQRSLWETGNGASFGMILGARAGL